MSLEEWGGGGGADCRLEKVLCHWHLKVYMDFTALVYNCSQTQSISILSMLLFFCLMWLQNKQSEYSKNDELLDK